VDSPSFLFRIALTAIGSCMPYSCPILNPWARSQNKVAIHVPAGITREVLKIHFTRYLRGNHVRYIYGIVLKYTVNTGESVFFLVVGGRRVFKFRVWCVVRLPFSLFSLSLFAPFPLVLCVRLQLQCSSPWTMVVRIQTSAKCY